MNADEPFETHQTGHWGRLLRPTAVEYAQDGKTATFEVQEDIDLQFREDRNIRSQKHMQIDVIIVSNGHVYAQENMHFFCA